MSGFSITNQGFGRVLLPPEAEAIGLKWRLLKQAENSTGMTSQVQYLSATFR
jgi:hypothetical protein